MPRSSALARAINRDALKGYEALYGKASHYTTSVLARAATLALHTGDFQGAREIAHRLMRLPKSATYAPVIEFATVMAALADDASISESALDQALQSRESALGEQAAMVLELRIDLAAVAIKRQQWARAQSLFDSVRAQVNQARLAALLPMHCQQTYNLATRAPNKNAALATSAQAKVTALLTLQQRQLLDPVSGQWLGLPVPNAALSSDEIRHAADRLREAHAGIKGQKTP